MLKQDGKVAAPATLKRKSESDASDLPDAKKNTITLPAGLMPSQGAMLMKNEHGQIVLVQPGSLSQQHSVSAVTISTSSTQSKVQYVRQPNPGVPQQLPSGQILSLKPGIQPQTMMRQAIQYPVNTIRPQSGVRVTLPQNVQTLVRTTVPAGTGTVGHHQAAITNHAVAAAQDIFGKSPNAAKEGTKFSVSNISAKNLNDEMYQLRFESKRYGYLKVISVEIKEDTAIVEFYNPEDCIDWTSPEDEMSVQLISSTQQHQSQQGANDGIVDGVDSGYAEKGGTSGLRKNIRPVSGFEMLADETKAAQKEERDRRKRITERQRKYNSFEQQPVKSTPANDIFSSPREIPVTTECVLESDKDTNTLIEVNKTLIRKLQPHQVEAVRFMYNCCIESIDRMNKDEGAGCILAHCMGLGKSLSVITFIHTMLSNVKLTKMSTCLIVCPVNTVLNWVEEFKKWLSDVVDFKIKVYEMSKVKDNYTRTEVLNKWYKGGAGVMIIGYDMFRNLVNGRNCDSKKQQKVFIKTLTDPGPNLVVCDEGHIIKNDQTETSKAINKIRTKRRIVLTGTPLQNKLEEYHCMVSFVKPNLLGTRTEFNNRFTNPITNGQCSDSTPADVKKMKRRSHILHELLAGCVQRKDYSVQTTLFPPKLEYVISVQLSKVQIALYEKYLEHGGISGGGIAEIQSKAAQLFNDYQALMRIWTHPWMLKMDEIRQDTKCQSSDNDSFVNDTYSHGEDFVLSDTLSSSNKDKHGKKDDITDVKNEENDAMFTPIWRGNDMGAGSSWMGGNLQCVQGLKEVSKWWAEYVKEDDVNKLELSGKLVLLFEILKMCEDIGDKVLVFSQSLLSLDIIENFLKKMDMSWIKEHDYFRMDGSTNVQKRKETLDIFNNPNNFRARLFLISTRAGSLGTNLVAANRVIIFDASWNPSHDIQSIFRAYRFGQRKPVYVYRFLAQGTMEEKIYERQVTKQSLAQRVLDEHQIERHFTLSDLQELYKFQPDRLDDPNRKERPLPMLPKDHMLADLMTQHKEWIVTFHKHDSLLENIVDQELNEEEKMAAWEDYENEKKGISTVMDVDTVINHLMAGKQMSMQDLSTLILARLQPYSELKFIQDVLSRASVGQYSPQQIIQDLKPIFPYLSLEAYLQRVQAILKQVLTQHIAADENAKKTAGDKKDE